jgi:hypothetical protein
MDLRWELCGMQGSFVLGKVELLRKRKDIGGEYYKMGNNFNESMKGGI